MVERRAVRASLQRWLASQRPEEAMRRPWTRPRRPAEAGLPPGELPFELLENHGPGVSVPVPRPFAGKARMREPEMATAAFGGRQLKRDDRLRPIGAAGTGHPGQLDQPIRLQPEKPTVVRVLVRRLEEERHVDLRLHQNRSWLGEPPVKSLGPGQVHRIHTQRHGPLDCQAIRSRRQVRRAEDFCHELLFPSGYMVGAYVTATLFVRSFGSHELARRCGDARLVDWWRFARVWPRADLT